MSNRLGPKTAGKPKKSPAPKAPTHSETKANTKAQRAKREDSMDKALKAIESGAPGQPARPTPTVKRKGA